VRDVAAGAASPAMTADEIKVILGRQPPPTCGFVAQTFRSRNRIPAQALPAGFEGWAARSARFSTS
jgi:hypothetical protein